MHRPESESLIRNYWSLVAGQQLSHGETVLVLSCFKRKVTWLNILASYFLSKIYVVRTLVSMHVCIIVIVVLILHGHILSSIDATGDVLDFARRLDKVFSFGISAAALCNQIPSWSAWDVSRETTKFISAVASLGHDRMRRKSHGRNRGLCAFIKFRSQPTTHPHSANAKNVRESVAAYCCVYWGAAWQGG